MTLKEVINSASSAKYTDAKDWQALGDGLKQCRNLTRRVDKTWGYEIWVANSELYCGKLLHFDAGKSCSLHFHVKKTETFFLHSGKVVIQLRDRDSNDSAINLWPGESLHIPAGTMHRITAIEDSDLFEFSTQHFDSDSYRVERSK